MHAKPVTIDLGVIHSSDGWVVGYDEKPTLHYDVSMGVYCYDARALLHLPPEGPCQFPDLVLRLLKAGEKVAAFRSNATWYDIGTLPEHERAQADLEANSGLLGLT